MTPPVPHDPEYVRDLSEHPYRQKMGARALASMLKADAEKDPNNNGAALRRRAASYDKTTLCYLRAIEETPVTGSAVNGASHGTSLVDETTRETPHVADPGRGAISFTEPDFDNMFADGS